jgi:hypothetical protein
MDSVVCLRGKPDGLVVREDPSEAAQIVNEVAMLGRAMAIFRRPGGGFVSVTITDIEYIVPIA